MSEVVDCGRCKGTGVITVRTGPGTGLLSSKQATCPICKGTGKVRV
jgi:DnaJ-class molecular chaperone